MALQASVVLKVRADGSDTLNGGGFYTISTGKTTDLTTTANTGNTATPEVSSASYNFVAGDVGHWLYLGAPGSNWIVGWYQITSVASNKATLDAAIGSVVLGTGAINTTAGISTAGTPTSGQWAIDYSLTAAAAFSLTGVTSSAANAIMLTTSATKAMVGNVVQVTGGTNATVGFYNIIAATAGVSLTVDRNWGTAAVAAGTVGIGGSLATVGQSSAINVAGSWTFVRNDAGTNNVTSATPSVAGGTVTLPAASSSTQTTRFEGMMSRWKDNGTAPTILAGNSISTFTVVTANNAGINVENLILDGASLTSSRGINTTASTRVWNVLCKNFTNTAITGNVNGWVYFCQATGCSTTAAFINGNFRWCSAYSNTITGFSACANIIGCVSANNSGGSSNGFALSGVGYAESCTAYTCGGAGFASTVSTNTQTLVNCLSVSNAGAALSTTASTSNLVMINFAHYGNGSGVTTNVTFPQVNTIALTDDPFVNAAGNNFALNTVAGGGASVRGLSQALAGLSSTTYPDGGAVQSQVLTRVSGAAG